MMCMRYYVYYSSIIIFYYECEIISDCIFYKNAIFLSKASKVSCELNNLSLFLKFYD